MGSSRKAAFRVAGVYAVVAGLWIVFSDSFVAMLPAGFGASLQTVKGLLFVLVTTLVLYALVLRWSEQVRAEMRHSESLEKVLAQVVETVPVGVVLLTDEGLVTFMNPTAEELLAVPSSEAVGRAIDQLGVMEQAEGIADLGALLSTGALDRFRLKRPGSEEGRAVLARSAVIDASQPGSGWVVAFADVTDAEEARERAAALLQGYQFLSHSVISMSSARDSVALLREICTHAVEHSDFVGAWAFVSNAADPASFESVLVGLGESTRSSARLLMEAYASDGQVGSRLVDGEVVVFNDVRRDPPSPWYTAANEDGFGSAASLAVTAQAGVQVSLTLFVRNAGYFDVGQVELLTAFRNALGFTVDRIGLETRRLEAEEAVVSSEVSYRSIFEGHVQPMYVFDQGTLRFLAVNEAALTRYGFTRDEFLDMKLTDIRPQEEVARFMGKVMQPAAGFEDAGLWTHMNRDGAKFPVHVYRFPLSWDGHDAELSMPVAI